jgi:hypothetical protein
MDSTRSSDQDEHGVFGLCIKFINWAEFGLPSTILTSYQNMGLAILKEAKKLAMTWVGASIKFSTPNPLVALDV